jgi:hypothetical protein
MPKDFSDLIAKIGIPPRNVFAPPRKDLEQLMYDAQEFADQTETIESEPKTGPIDGLRSWFNGWNDRRQNQIHATRTDERAREKIHDKDERSALDKMRDKVAEFDEDYKGMGERILGFFMQLVGYVGPFVLVVWIGSDLGKYFEDTMGTMSAYGLAYTMECIIAACTIGMGRAWGEISSGKANWGRMCAIMAIWIILNASSAFGLYLVITKGIKDISGFTEFVMVARVVAIALCDLGCAAVLMFKGMSLQKHIESIRKRATAIGDLADAQRQIEEADKNAALRDQMMKSTLRIQEDLSQKIGEAVSMVMSSILEKMEKALKEDDQGKNDRGFGRR